MATMVQNAEPLYRKWPRGKLMRRLLDLGVALDETQGNHFAEAIGRDKALATRDSLWQQADAITAILGQKGVTAERCDLILSGRKDLVS